MATSDHGVSRAARLRAALLLGWILLLAAALGAVPGCGGSKAAGDGAAGDSTAVSDSSKAEAEDEEPEKERVVSVNAARVEMGELVVPVVAEGTVRARQSTEIRAEIAGRVDKLEIDEGTVVRRGQVLARIDDREYHVALEEARSRYLEAIGRLAVDEEDLTARTATDKLEAQLKELDDMVARGSITAAERTERRIALEVEAVKQGAYRNELVQVRSGLAAARAAQERAELDLEHTVIRAPFAGVVDKLGISQGERVTLGEVLCELVDNVNLEAEVAVLESDLAGLAVGRPVRLEVPAVGRTLDVTVDVMSPAIDPVSRTLSVLMRFTSDDGAIRPGMFTRASIAGEILTDRLLVPREAILIREGRPLLFRIEDDRAKWVYVEPGRSNDRQVEIANVLQGGPLDPGTLVVVSDHLTLTHDAKVKVKKVLETGGGLSAATGDD